MRPRCKCGNIAGYWYAPKIYVRMRVDQFIHEHCLCESCADTENWAEYEYVGFHKKDWRWLKLKWIAEIVHVKDAWMDKPYYSLSCLVNGFRNYMGIARTKEEVDAMSAGKEGVKVVEERYRDIRGIL